MLTAPREGPGFFRKDIAADDSKHLLTENKHSKQLSHGAIDAIKDDAATHLQDLGRKEVTIWIKTSCTQPLCKI